MCDLLPLMILFGSHAIANLASEPLFSKSTATGDAKTAIDNNAAAGKRSERDQLLKETDFYALSDVTMSEEMKTYRQSLRDIPTTSGADWPHNVTWPTKPS